MYELRPDLKDQFKKVLEHHGIEVSRDMTTPAEYHTVDPFDLMTDKDPDKMIYASSKNATDKTFTVEGFVNVHKWKTARRYQVVKIQEEFYVGPSKVPAQYIIRGYFK